MAAEVADFADVRSPGGFSQAATYRGGPPVLNMIFKRWWHIHHQNIPRSLTPVVSISSRRCGAVHPAEQSRDRTMQRVLPFGCRGSAQSEAPQLWDGRAWDIGRLCFREHHTRREIHQSVRQRGVSVSEREVQNLYEEYLVLLRCSASETMNQRRSQMAAFGGLVISLAGVQAEKGNETLWVVRDVLTGTTLNAANLTSSDATNLTALLRPVLELGLPVLRVVSDAQKSIRRRRRSPVPRRASPAMSRSFLTRYRSPHRQRSHPDYATPWGRE
jgi:hypothetical protein